MRIASITMVGQFPDGIDLHARNLRWARSDRDHSFIVTFGSFIKTHNLRSDERTTYIECGECKNIQTFFPFWREFPRIVREQCIDPEWFLFMEQDIWFYEKILEYPLPNASEIRSYLPLQNHYHSVMINGHLYHPRVWEGSNLVCGRLVRRAIGFGVDFSGHANWFINKDREYWEQQVGGVLSMGQYGLPDTMDEFTLYCALVEKTRVAYCSGAVHLQGPEALHRYNPELYGADDIEEATLHAVSERWQSYFSVYAALAVYFIAGIWKQEADWKRIQRRYRPEFEKLILFAKEWMKTEEYERLQKVVVGFR